MEINIQKYNEFKLLEESLFFKTKVYDNTLIISLESSNKKEFYTTFNLNSSFLEDNQSNYQKDFLRRFLYQKCPYASWQFVRSLKGKVFDITLDIRVKTETFCQWIRINLESFIKKYLYSQEDFAYIYLSLSHKNIFSYKLNQSWMRIYGSIIRYKNPQIPINWPKINMQSLLPEKDIKAKKISNFKGSNL